MIRVLVVDDSPTMRALLSSLLGQEADIEVIGTAANAEEARGMIRVLDPDVVTLDIEMPGMNGLDFLEKIMRLRPTPVIIVSGLTRANTDATARALEIGAVDCYAKPQRAGQLLTDDGGRLAGLVRQAAQVRMRGREPSRQMLGSTVRAIGSHDVRLVAVGASTGGVEALTTMLGAFPADCPPTLVVQHVNGAFAGAIARRLDQHCAPTVRLAEPDLPLRRGHVYIAPGNERHLQVQGIGTMSAKLRVADPVSGHRPSVDMLFLSVAQNAAAGAVGVLLTGMGSDGAAGLLAMRRAGCVTIVQDEATSTVYGMPRAAAEMGAAQFVLGLPDIASRALAGGVA
ncbi:protein-glutamate methylesterase/protein-glutamine glutaminase [Sphingomonas morindae]|uniref:Protein-glutamate methylesterase/protein-glutamine glutaminase n=1 Tax=Sphingomonas morindae TaxID=1541170 RepID=A0ABY4X494_9SPHN|nr:chemotaxis response regulator protein-glutamate methylesterase [Sphingomonas morindae]USI71713.1 chemotaxis response regulator protein-glutamate methylesterase [Sphingomonas morindae]